MVKNKKTEKAFELSDLLFLRKKDELTLNLDEDISRISHEFNIRGVFYSSMHVKKIIDKKIEIVDQLVNFKVKQDIKEIDNIIDCISKDVYKKINKRANKLVDSLLESLKCEMENFCKHFPGPSSYLSLVDSRLNEEKARLIDYSKREVEIFKRKSESNIKKNEKEKNPVIFEIIEKIDSINLLMGKIYKIKLFDIQEQKIWNTLIEPCHNKKDFVLMINALSSLVDWMNIKDLEKILKTKPQNGSINYLERLLQEKYPDYDKNIIKRIRRIKSIRKMSPVHKDTNESIKAIEELGESYPNTNYTKLWEKILLDFYISLRQLEEIFSN
jgi:hypothetical protein